MTLESADARSERRRAFVLDYGFEPADQADQVVDVEFQTGLREPDAASRFGVYVDHVYS